MGVWQAPQCANPSTRYAPRFQAAGFDESASKRCGVKYSAFQAIMSFDSVAIGFSGVALVAYMSTLTSLGYTATQYALLTSALAWTGKFLKGCSGASVEALHSGRSLLDA